MGSFYSVLEKVQADPGLYLGESSLKLLYAFINGYKARHEQIGGALPDFEDFAQNFQSWCQNKFQADSAVPWVQIISTNSENDQAALGKFFELLSEFRSGRPLSNDSFSFPFIRNTSPGGLNIIE